jgi:hypothetical protein
MSRDRLELREKLFSIMKLGSTMTTSCKVIPSYLLPFSSVNHLSKIVGAVPQT